MRKCNIIGIYKIVSPTNKVYIGQSWDIIPRKNKYSRLICQKQKKLYASFVKYGWEAHKFEIIHILPRDINQEILNNYEILYWQLYKDCGVEMLNVKEPGSRGKNSKETIQKMKQNSWLKGRKGNVHPAFGKKQSIEHTEKIMSQRRGVNHPMYGRKWPKEEYEKFCRKVIDSNTGIIFNSVKEASEKTKINLSTLSAYLTGRLKNKTTLEYFKF